MAKNTKQPPWFKMWLRDKPLVDIMSDVAVGRAVKAAYSYFDTAEMVDIEPEDLALFAMLKSHIDEAYSDYQRDVENGKKGGRPKATNGADTKPTVKGGNPGYPPQTEGEEEAEIAPEETTVTISEDLYKTLNLVAETTDISVEELCLKILDKWASKK